MSAIKIMEIIKGNKTINQLKVAPASFEISNKIKTKIRNGIRNIINIIN